MERHVFAYSQGRSSKIYVGVSDLDLGSMTILSTRVSWVDQTQYKESLL